MLLKSSELTIAGLMADLPLQRHRVHQLEAQLLALREGLELEDSPLRRQQATAQHVVVEGETLQSVSLIYFGDARYWEAIASTNEIDYPFEVWAGLMLTLPELEH